MVNRRAAFGQIAGAAAVVALPQLAFADGAVSAATIARARGLYGDRISALKSAVDKGDFDAVAEEKNAFILFNSGAYPRNVDKASKKAAVDSTNAIFAAIRSRDKAALKSAYSSYVASNDISPLPDMSKQEGQSYSGDYDYRARGKVAKVYVR